MAEVTNELIYEVLKKIQDELGQLRSGQRTQGEEISAMRGHLVAIQKDIHNLYDIGHDTGHNRRLDFGGLQDADLGPRDIALIAIVKWEIH